jgi:putative transposase
LSNGENTTMNYNPDKHHRKSIRLKHYDYSQAGAYFVTMVTQHRQHFFGEIQQGDMILNAAGEMIDTIWYGLPQRFPHIELDMFVVMPNHVHGIIIQTHESPSIAGAGLVPAPTAAKNQPPLRKTQQMKNETVFISKDAIGASTRDAPTQSTIKPTLGDVVGAFKSLTTHAYIVGVREHGWSPFDKRLWQRNYFERIVRDDAAMNNIRAYIQNNPKQWGKDSENKNTGVKS